MPTALEIRQHIRAVEQTRKVTHAMHLVASARMKRVLEHIEYNQLYLKKIRSAMRDILQAAPAKHPYLTQQGKDTRTYVVLAGDKGLAGSYNHDILNFAWNELQKYPGASLVTIGQMAAPFFRAKGRAADIDILNVTQDPSLYNAQRITFEMIDMYNKGLTGKVYIVYTQFRDDVRGVPRIARLLPLQVDDYADLDDGRKPRDMIFIPSAQELFDSLIPQYLVGIIFGAMVQAYASEHLARMNAMNSATRNADEIVERLRLRYNMARQAAITQELSEISGATESRGGDGAYDDGR